MKKFLVIVSLLLATLNLACQPETKSETSVTNFTNYLPYSEEAFAKAQTEGTAVLFFYADWCPTCKIANENFINKNSEIPAGITILKTNYDTEKELKKKYQVVIQHTFVVVDEKGNEVTKWVGGDIPELKQELGL